MKKKLSAFEIALSGIACAIAATALTVGSYVQALLAGSYVLASFAVMLPLSKEFYWGAALCFLGSIALAFLTSGFAFLYLVPYALFFGLHPVVNRLQKRFVKGSLFHALVFLAKAVWFDLSMWLSFVILVPLLGLEGAAWYPVIEQYFFLVLFLGGTLFFAVYDVMIFFCARSVDRIVARIGGGHA